MDTEQRFRIEIRPCELQEADQLFTLRREILAEFPEAFPETVSELEALGRQ